MSREKCVLHVSIDGKKQKANAPPPPPSPILPPMISRIRKKKQCFDWMRNVESLIYGLMDTVAAASYCLFVTYCMIRCSQCFRSLSPICVSYCISFIRLFFHLPHELWCADQFSPWFSCRWACARARNEL